MANSCVVASMVLQFADAGYCARCDATSGCYLALCEKSWQSPLVATKSAVEVIIQGQKPATSFPSFICANIKSDISSISTRDNMDAPPNTLAPVHERLLFYASCMLRNFRALDPQPLNIDSCCSNWRPAWHPKTTASLQSLWLPFHEP